MYYKGRFFPDESKGSYDLMNSMSAQTDENPSLNLRKDIDILAIFIWWQ